MWKRKDISHSFEISCFLLAEEPAAVSEQLQIAESVILSIQF